MKPTLNPLTGNFDMIVDHASCVKVNTIPIATNRTVQAHINNFASAGLLSGGEITDAGSETINVAAGEGTIRSSDAHDAPLFHFDFSAETGLAIPTDTTRFIGIERNVSTGVVSVVVKSADSWNTHTEFALGTVVNEGGTLHILCNPEIVTNFGMHALHRLYETEPFQRADRIGGLILGESGDTNRKMLLTAGEIYDRLTEFTIAEINTAVAGSFDSYSSGGLESSDNTIWDNDNYDSSGILTSLSANKFANLWFYLDIDTPELICIYGTAQYATAGKAEEEGTPQTVPDRVLYQSKLVGRIIFQKGGTTAVEVQSVFTMAFGAAGVTTHNNLSGLQGGTAGEYFHLTSAEEGGNWGAKNLTTTGTVQASHLRAGVAAGSGTLAVRGIATAEFLAVDNVTINSNTVATIGSNTLVLSSGSGHMTANGHVYPSDANMDLGNAIGFKWRTLNVANVAASAAVAGGTVTGANVTSGHDPGHTHTGTPITNAVIMWDETIVNITTCWLICDGTNGTPDLREKFVRGAGDGDEVGATGGSETHIHSVSGSSASTAINHLHLIESTNTAISASTSQQVQAGTGAFVACTGHIHCINQVGGTTGLTNPVHCHTVSFNSAACSTLPSYYEIIFIKRAA